MQWRDRGSGLLCEDMSYQCSLSETVAGIFLTALHLHVPQFLHKARRPRGLYWIPQWSVVDYIYPIH